MIELSNITILCVDCYNFGKAVSALQKCNQQVKAASVKLLTNIPLEIDGIEVVQIPTISSKEEYSHFMIKELNKYFETEYCLVVQHDGYILNGDCWNGEFLNYDFIGAPWLYTDGKNIANGGFSIRSKKLQKILAEDEFIQASDPEDQAIGRLYRDYLIKQYGIKYPSEELADTFSFELREPKCKTFGFHGNFHNEYVPSVVIKRSAALGDTIIMEPILRYYAAKGYNVVVDIPIDYYQLYNQHYFPIKHISQFDRGRIKPEVEINLDLAYEVKPRQNYLKSYFEFCGITDYQLSRPILYPLVNEKTKLFKKYAIIHIDRRETAHRNIYGIKWEYVVKHLETLGYSVFQIGANDRESVATEINTSSIGHMKFVIAGADIFLGVDSAPSHIAAAYNIPSVIFFGSVCPSYIHADLTNIEPIYSPCPKQFCWHVTGGTAGVECEFKGTDSYLQCCVVSWETVNDAIDKLIKK